MKTESRVISFPSKDLPGALAAVLATAMLATSGNIMAEQVKANNPANVVDVVTTAGWNSNNMARLAMHTGEEIVHHLMAAQDALQKNESGKALGNLISARRLNNSAMQMMPFVTVNEHTQNARGKLALGESGVFYDELLPIYAELDALEIYAPTAAQKARKHLKQAEAKARKGDNKAAMESLQNVMDVVAETKLYLPVMYVEGQLDAAINALSGLKRNASIAKTAITNALESLTTETDEAIVAPQSGKAK